MNKTEAIETLNMEIGREIVSTPKYLRYFFPNKSISTVNLKQPSNMSK